MTDRVIIIIGFAVIGVATVAGVLASHVRRDRLATVAETLDQLVRTRPAKIIAIVVWAWLGWHFLAR